MTGSITYIIWLLILFGSCCHMAPADDGAGTISIFQIGFGQVYDYQTTVLLNEVPGQKSGSEVGFQISAKLSVSVIWQNPENLVQKLFELQLNEPKLHIKSREKPDYDVFKKHKSKLETMENRKYYILWEAGKVTKTFIYSNERNTMKNLKKGIASLFQFQLIDQEIEESDASGHCHVQYTTLDVKTILKLKSRCSSKNSFPHNIWDVKVKSERKSLIELTSDLSKIKSISSDESHIMNILIYKDAGSSVISRQHITLTDTKLTPIIRKEETLSDVIYYLKEEAGPQTFYDEENLMLRKDFKECYNCPKFNEIVNENREYLGTKYLGTVKSAMSFIRLLKVARVTNYEYFKKVFDDKINKNILPQLIDLMGATQTPEAHLFTTNFISIELKEKNADLCERYMWALSFGSHPLKDVLKGLYEVSLKKIPPKVRDTAILSLAALLKKVNKSTHTRDKEIELIEQNLINKINDCSKDDEDCKLLHLRAFQNLQSVKTIPILIYYAINGNRRISVRAMKTLKSMHSEFWNADVLDTAEKIYFQIGKIYDSSSRALAIDILLESNPKIDILKSMILSLKKNDSSYELQQYLIQRINQLSERNSLLSDNVNSILNSMKLFNYNNLALKGLSTAFTRTFMNNTNSKGYLTTVQEISNGIVKQGSVDIILENNDINQSIFNLGIFAGGLSSFISSNEDVSMEDAEVATAGMELIVLGVLIRPFTFFFGQGELMGHIWSGTASEMTPAFQSIIPLHDFNQDIPLESGFVAELSVLGSASFDLSGEVQMSLWNRNAQSFVGKNAGIAVVGSATIDTELIKSQVEFNLGTEAKLNLVSNIDFYTDIALCLQLKQPTSVVRHNVFKIERIQGSKHKLRKSKYKSITVPGRTYALNQKNNKMCNMIFQ